MWIIVLTTLSTFIMIGILAIFYATDHKPLAMRLMRTVNPGSAILPWLTQNMRLNVLTARMYDFLVVVMATLQGLVLGSLIDFFRWLRRRDDLRTIPS
jgi:hypothetical protein